MHSFHLCGNYSAINFENYCMRISNGVKNWYKEFCISSIAKAFNAFYAGVLAWKLPSHAVCSWLVVQKSQIAGTPMRDGKRDFFGCFVKCQNTDQKMYM